VNSRSVWTGKIEIKGHTDQFGRIDERQGRKGVTICKCCTTRNLTSRFTKGGRILCGVKIHQPQDRLPLTGQVSDICGLKSTTPSALLPEVNHRILSAAPKMTLLACFNPFCAEATFKILKNHEKWTQRRPSTSAFSYGSGEWRLAKPMSGQLLVIAARGFEAYGVVSVIPG